MNSIPLSVPLNAFVRLAPGMGMGMGAENLTITPDIYVDSVNGSDANDGLTAGTALQTLAAAQAAVSSGDVIGLARGSSWREMFSIRQAGTSGTFTAKVQPFGSGDPPQVSSADVIAPNLFSPSLHADAGGVTYEYAWIRGAGFEDGWDQVMLWENDTRLYRRASVALVAANPGSYYAPGEEAASSTIYIHPYGSTDPRSDGKTYEVTKRGSAIDTYAAGNAGSDVTGPIHVLRSWAHIGPVGGPWLGGKATKILIGGGGVHHIVTSVAEASDIVLYDIAKNYGSEMFPYVAYYSNGLGLRHTAKRVISHGDSGADATSKAFNAGFYSHGLSNGFDVVTYEQCAQTYAKRGFSCTNPEIRANGCFLDNVGTAFLVPDNTTISIKHAMAKAVTAEAFNDAGPINTASRTRVIENCVFDCSGATAQGFRINTGGSNGTLVIRNCVIIGDFTRALEVTTPLLLNIVVERCIFVRTATAQVIFYPRIGTGSYTGTNNVFWTLSAASAGSAAATFNKGGSNMTFAQWQADGNDLNSQLLGAFNGYDALTDLFVEDPRTNGNYTLRTDTGLTFGDGAAITTAGPQEYWDWNTRAVASGPPTKYPTIPTTLADMKAYVANPKAWNFYP